MIIGIDGNEANVAKRVGISEFAYELLMKFKNLKPSNTEFRIYLKTKQNDDFPKESEYWKYRIVRPSKLWTQFALPLDLYINKPRPDVFFCPSHYAPRFCPVPTVISIMDLSYVYYPQMFKKSDLYQLKNWTSYSVKKAAKVITISSTSKDDIINTYGISASRVDVVHPGIKGKNDMNNSKIIIEKYGINREFILFVGTLQPRKNIVRLVEAFSKIPNPLRKMDLIVVGKKGWMYDEILSAPSKFHVEDRVKFLEFVSDDELEKFYKNALCFVLPSLYEGFGLPILEAMKNGCPVITSKISSMPEAGGDAAIYIDPENIDEISKAIEQVISNEKLRKEMIEKGYKHIKKFSWEKSAKKVLEVLEEVGNK